jgi:F-type H+-transporting ATPase subunit c
MELLAFGLTYAIPALAAAIGVGMIGSAALNAAGRNPEKVNDYRTLMILAIAFADALAIIGLVAAIVGNSMV